MTLLQLVSTLLLLGSLLTLRPVSSASPVEYVSSSMLETVLDNIQSQHLLVMSDNGHQITEFHKAVNSLQSHTTVTLVSCDIERLFATLSHLLYSQATHTVVLDCVFPTVEQVFLKIKRENLENRLVQWVVIGEKNYPRALLPSLRETVQIAILYFEGNRLVLETTKANINNELMFEKISLMKSKGRDIFMPLLEKYSNFQGRTLTVATNDNPTTFVQYHKDENGKIIPEGGIDIKILNMIAENHNFKYELVETPDGSWGGPKEDGSITGLIGMAARQDAHFSIDDITLTALRETVVDFTVPYIGESSIIISSRPALKSPALTVVRPFYEEVWIGIVLSVLIVGTTTVIISFIRTKSNDHTTLQPSPRLIDYYFNLVAVFVAQRNTIRVDRPSIAVLMAIWYFYGEIFTTSYSGSLTAAFAAPSYEKPIDTFHDVINAVLTTDKNIMMTKDTSMHYMFKRATSGIYQKINEILDPTESFKYKKLTRYSKAKEGKGIIFTTPLSYYPKAVATGHKNYHMGKDVFYTQFYGFAFPSGSPFLPAIDNTILRLVESGMIQNTINNVLTDMISVRIMDEIRRPKESKANSKAISIAQLTGAFILLGIGMALATAAALLEIFIGRCVKKQG